MMSLFLWVAFRPRPLTRMRPPLVPDCRRNPGGTGGTECTGGTGSLDDHPWCGYRQQWNSCMWPCCAGYAVLHGGKSLLAMTWSNCCLSNLK